MNEKKIHSAKVIIKSSVILRLLWNTFLSVWMASSYSSLIDNLMRINLGGTDLPFVIIGLLIDTLLAVLWLYKPIFHTIHLVVYIMLGWLYYGKMLGEILVLNGMGGALAVLVIMPFLCLIGIIPFIVCGVGRRKLTKATSENTNNRPPRKLEKCQIPQNVLSCAKWLDRRNTICIARESRKAQGKRDKEDGASEVSEEV